MVGAYFRMDNLSAAKADIAASLAALKEPHCGSSPFSTSEPSAPFIGFAGVFPKLLADTFPDFKGIAIGTGPSPRLPRRPRRFARPALRRKLADRFGGPVITIGAFTVMGLGILSVILTCRRRTSRSSCSASWCCSRQRASATARPMHDPTIFALRSNGGIGAQRKAAAALGLISAIGAYGGFFIPQVLGFSKTTFGSYVPARQLRRRVRDLPRPHRGRVPADVDKDRHPDLTP